MSAKKSGNRTSTRKATQRHRDQSRCQAGRSEQQQSGKDQDRATELWESATTTVLKTRLKLLALVLGVVSEATMGCGKIMLAAAIIAGLTSTALADENEIISDTTMPDLNVCKQYDPDSLKVIQCQDHQISVWQFLQRYEREKEASQKILEARQKILEERRAVQEEDRKKRWEAAQLDCERSVSACGDGDQQFQDNCVAKRNALIARCFARIWHRLPVLEPPGEPVPPSPHPLAQPHSLAQKCHAALPYRGYLKPHVICDN